MAASRQSFSPTANLLRHSRLFSLPKPLPKPAVSGSTGGITKSSDTATLPFPTHQAITTTKSSLARGDWGLKRPLPARSYLVQVSDPVFRIKQLDTIEHITDFDSAADHVRTREKWQEMGTPMMKGLATMREFDISVAKPKGAFEARDDTTSYDTDLGLDEAGLYLEALQTSIRKRAKDDHQDQFTPFTPPPVDPAVHNSKRWKHDGPWLPGMGADEFVAFLIKQISRRKKEFNDYLVAYVKNKIYTTRRLAASKAGSVAPEDLEEAEQWQAQQEERWRTISRAEVAAGIGALRKETANDPLGSQLFSKLIVPFLRLPSIKFKYRNYAMDASRRDVEQYQFDQDNAPLSTHPSAGLGYLRTKAYVANHPILGPQLHPTPVPARVVQARVTAQSKENYARLGVAGFVANDQYRSNDVSSGSRTNINNARDVETIDIDTKGGKKVMVQPQFGSVTNDGRIHIKLLRSVGAEVQVARGELEDRPPVREHLDDSSPLGNLSSSMGPSGIKELDEQSEQAQRMSNFLNSITPPAATGRSSPSSPAVQDK
ncbi:hypothetical protein ACN47E_002790 [Coniothyrium glycines]